MTRPDISRLRELWDQVMITADKVEPRGIDYHFISKDGRLIGISDADDEHVMKLAGEAISSLPDLIAYIERMEADRATARAALLLIWPDGEKCQHEHAKAAFEAMRP